jgi:hypothetical protein
MVPRTSSRFQETHDRPGNRGFSVSPPSLDGHAAAVMKDNSDQ